MSNRIKKVINKVIPLRVIKEGENPKYSYRINGLKGEYAIRGYDKNSGRYILEKLKDTIRRLPK